MTPVGAVERFRERRSGLAAAAAVAVAAPLLLTGCGQRTEPTGAKVDLYPVTVQQPSGPPIVLSEKPGSVAALTPQAATLLSSILGRTVEAQGSPGNAELVVITPESLNKRTRRVYVAPDESIADVERALTELGLLLDRPIRARQLVGEIESKRKLVQRKLRGVKPVTVFVDTGFYTTVSTNTLVGNLIAEAGGRNIAGAAPQAGPFPVGTLVKLDPDYYLATSDSGTKLADLRRDPRTRRLKAVRQGHFAILAAKVLEPGGQVGDELEAIARYLHPNAFR
jgi:ABC-type Fe3+-hydroxamate transport system substrate-binding protein